MLIKAFIVIVMLLILVSLGSGLFYLIRDEGRSKKNCKSFNLAYRFIIKLICFITTWLFNRRYHPSWNLNIKANIQK